MKAMIDAYKYLACATAALLFSENCRNINNTSTTISEHMHEYKGWRPQGDHDDLKFSHGECEYMFAKKNTTRAILDTVCKTVVYSAASPIFWLTVALDFIKTPEYKQIGTYG